MSYLDIEDFEQMYKLESKLTFLRVFLEFSKKYLQRTFFFSKQLNQSLSEFNLIWK